MALEEFSTTMSKISFGFFGSESEKKVGSFLFNEKTEWASSRELHGLAALTFNDRECAGVIAVIGKALEPKDNTWRTLHKAVRLLHHFVLYGAERCVDHAWDHQRQVEELQRYNSAIHGRTAALNGGGTDFGRPVRKAATELVELLKNTEAIREAREEGRAPDALLPMGAPDDYRAPTKAKEIDLGNDDVFGVIPQGSMGAKFDLKQVPGMYEGRPERYFDNKHDSRRRTTEVEDSDYTRQALAPDLLDLDLGEAQSSTIPESQDLVRASKEAALQEQLQVQQQQLEKLKFLMLTQAQQRQQQPGGVASTGMGVTTVGQGTGIVGVSNGIGQGARSGNPADRVMEAFSSVGLGGTVVASPGLGGGGGAMANLIQTSSEGVGSFMGGIGSTGGGAVGLGMVGRGQHNPTGIDLGHGIGGGGGGLVGALPMQQRSPGGNPQQVGLGAGMGLGMGGVSGGMGGVGISGGAASGLTGGMSMGKGGGGIDLGKPGTHGGVGMNHQRHQWFPGQG